MKSTKTGEFVSVDSIYFDVLGSLSNLNSFEDTVCKVEVLSQECIGNAE